MFITNATGGDFLVVLCVTDPKNQKKHNRMSTKGEGFYQLMNFFNRARLDGGAALAVGTAQGALESAIHHVKLETKQLKRYLSGRSYWANSEEGSCMFCCLEY